jgi:hypothetical protein
VHSHVGTAALVARYRLDPHLRGHNQRNHHPGYRSLKLIHSVPMKQRYVNFPGVRMHRRKSGLLVVVCVLGSGLISWAQIAQTNQAVTPGVLTANPASLNFGNVTVGSKQTLLDTLTSSGGSTLTVTQITPTGAGYSVGGVSLPLTLAPGQRVPFNVMFAPQSVGTSTGNLAIANTGSTAMVNVPLSGSGVPPGVLTANPTSLNFGNVTVGSKQTLLDTLTNSGGSTLTVTQITPSGAGYSMSGVSLPLTIAPGQSVPFNVMLAPQAVGTSTGNLSIVNTGSTALVSVSLSGSGVTPGVLTANPASLNFGNVTVGSKQTLLDTLTNSGGSTLTVTQITPTGAGYSVGGVSLPLTLAPGQRVPFNVMFAPQSVGTSTGNLAIANTGSTAMVNVPLSGSGVPPGVLTANPTSLNFGNVTVGSKQTLLDTLTNSGGSTLTVTQITPSGAGYSMSGVSLPLTIAPGQRVPFNVMFAPQAVGPSTGNLSIVNTGSTALVSLPLSGSGVTPGVLTANPASLNFGNVTVGTKQTLPETLTNSGGANVNVSQASVAGTGFSMNGLTPPVVLTPGQHYTFTVSFTPPATGKDSGNVSVVSDASNPNLAIPLTGTGTPQGQLAVSPAIIDFGDVVVGTNAQRTGTLSASGETVSVYSDVVNGSAFALSGLPSFPITIPAGQQVQFGVTFTPQADSVIPGNISFASNASNSPTIESLTGVGTHPVQPNPIVASFLPSDKIRLRAFNRYVVPHISAVMVRIDWSQIESNSAQGVYDFRTLDAELGHWTNQGKNVALLISLNDDGVLYGFPDPAVPAYVYTAAWALQCCNAPPLDTIQCQPGWSPFPAVYEKPFAAAAEPFLSAVLAHLDGNSHVLYVRPGFIEGGENTPVCHWIWPGLSKKVLLDYFTEMTNFVAGLHSTTRVVNNANAFMGGNPIADAEAAILHRAGVGIGMQDLSVADKTNYDNGKPCQDDWCAWATRYPDAYGYLQPGNEEQLGDPTIYIPFAKSFHIAALEVYATDLLIAYDPNNEYYPQYHGAYQQAFGLP